MLDGFNGVDVMERWEEWRVLSDGEPVRQGDASRFLLRRYHHFDSEIPTVTEAVEKKEYWRRARFKGVPHGWRLADMGERSYHWLQPDGEVNGPLEEPDIMCIDSQLEHSTPEIMPWPEDPRLAS